MTITHHHAPALLALALACALTGCAQPRGAEIGPGTIETRADGVLLSVQRAQLVSRLRLPMDHGRDVQPDRIDSRVFVLSETSETLRLRELSPPPVWHRRRFAGAEHDALKYPAYIVRDGAAAPHACRHRTIASAAPPTISCLSSATAPQIVQIGQRSEPIALTGTRLTFAAGLDGQARPCAVDLSAIAADITQPISVSENAPNLLGDRGGLIEDRLNIAGYRLALAYQPPATAYLADYGQATLPLYRATCAGITRVGDIGSMVAALTAAAPDIQRDTIEVIDIVADPDQTQPAVLVTFALGENGARMAVLRAGRPPRIIPYFCNDCLPSQLSFYRSSPDWLLFDAGITAQAGGWHVGLTLFDMARNQEVTRSLDFPNRGRWPTL